MITSDNMYIRNIPGINSTGFMTDLDSKETVKQSKEAKQNLVGYCGKVVLWTSGFFGYGLAYAMTSEDMPKENQDMIFRTFTVLGAIAGLTLASRICPSKNFQAKRAKRLEKKVNEVEAKLASLTEEGKTVTEEAKDLQKIKDVFQKYKTSYLNSVREHPIYD